jgi:hypothetical protein
LFTNYLKSKPEGGDGQGDLNWKNIMESISKMNSNPEAINKKQESSQQVPDLQKDGIDLGNQTQSLVSDKDKLAAPSLNEINS